MPAVATVDLQLMENAAAAQARLALCHMEVEVLIQPSPLGGQRLSTDTLEPKTCFHLKIQTKSNAMATELRERQTHSTL